MDEGLPDNEYREYFAPDYKLQLQSDPSVVDQNTREYTDGVVREVLSQLARHASFSASPVTQDLDVKLQKSLTFFIGSKIEDGTSRSKLTCKLG